MLPLICSVICCHVYHVQFGNWSRTNNKIYLFKHNVIRFYKKCYDRWMDEWMKNNNKTKPKLLAFLIKNSNLFLLLLFNVFFFFCFFLYFVFCMPLYEWGCCSLLFLIFFLINLFIMFQLCKDNYVQKRYFFKWLSYWIIMLLNFIYIRMRMYVKHVSVYG